MKKYYPLFSFVFLFLFINSLTFIEAIESIQNNSLYIEVTEIETDTDTERFDFDAILVPVVTNVLLIQNTFNYYTQSSNQHQTVVNRNYQQRAPPLDCIVI